jgi:GntR family transcriptional regulator
MILFEVNHESDVPIWVQLRKRLVYLINTGHYQPGDQLPTVRGMASELSINYNTVNKAYLSLAHDGYITSTRGRGVFVNETTAATDETELEAEGMLDEFIEHCQDIGLSSWGIRKLLAKRLRILDAERDEATGLNQDQGT